MQVKELTNFAGTVDVEPKDGIVEFRVHDETGTRLIWVMTPNEAREWANQILVAGGKALGIETHAERLAFGRRVLSARMEQRWTRRELAEKADVPERILTRIELGTITLDNEAVARVKRVLFISWLFGGRHEPVS